MNTITEKPGLTRRADYLLVLVLMIAAGVARIALVATPDIEPMSPCQPVCEDPVSIRRNVQLVSCGVHALLARYGLALASVPGGGGPEAMAIAGAGLSK